ncbi:MAG: glycogen/starch synthase [Patescibacteria group bacterium]|nr:glycogen synthase [Patescibacteria group bacterium]
MKVLIVASECFPVVKVGGLGDVIGSLPKALKKAGLDVRIVIPGYQKILHTWCESQAQHHTGCGGEDKSRDFVIHYAGEAQKVILHQTVLPETDIPLYLIENEKYISSGGIYMDPSAFASSQEEIERFAFFSKAVVGLFVAREDVFFPDIVHCNDWHTGIISQLIKSEARYLELNRPATIFTIHNLANQGISSTDVVNKLDGEILSKSPYIKWDTADNNLDFIMQGILGSDVVTTVSPSYAEEIKTQEFGEGLNEVIKAKEARVFGVLNGIDKDVFNPKTDQYLKVNYSPEDLEAVLKGKSANKKLLQQELSLQEKSVPMIGLVSRLTNQKGIDIFVSSVDEMISMGFQIVILGTGDKAIENRIVSKMSEPELSGNCAGIIKFDEGVARRVYAAADFFAVPSRFEPCGLTQMIAMRYGAVPIVRAVGGLKDTVKEGETGFLFEGFNQSEFLSVIKRAKRVYDDKNLWGKIVGNCIAEDFSWDKSAQEYILLYAKALAFAQ